MPTRLPLAPAPVAAEPALADTPLPALTSTDGTPHPRHDAITPERQRVFLEAFAATGSVTEAARQAGASRQAFYTLRHREPTGPFATAWESASDRATHRLADVAYERAIEGVEEPVFQRGEQVGTRRRYNDRLLMALLRVRNPAHYAPLPWRRGFQFLVPDGSGFARALDKVHALAGTGRSATKRVK